MGPKTVIEIRRPEGRTGNVVEYVFHFDRWHCGWDALHMVEYEGITFPLNKRFAWCGPQLGLTPSCRDQNLDTVLRLPDPAILVTIEGHTGNEHYGFEGSGLPLEAVTSRGTLADSGMLPAAFALDAKPLILKGPDIRRIRIPTSKPVVFIRKIRVEYASTPKPEPRIETST